MLNYKGHTWIKKQGCRSHLSEPARFEDVLLLTEKEYNDLPDTPIYHKSYSPKQFFKRDFRRLFERDIYTCNLQKL